MVVELLSSLRQKIMQPTSLLTRKDRRNSKQVLENLVVYFRSIEVGLPFELSPQAHEILNDGPVVIGLDHRVWPVVADSIQVYRALRRDVIEFGLKQEVVQPTSMANLLIGQLMTRFQDIGVPPIELDEVEGRWHIVDLGLSGTEAAAFLTVWGIDRQAAVEIAQGWSGLIT